MMKLEATTIQSHHIKQFFSSLKEQISDTELECSQDGIRIQSIDTTHIVCVHAELDATKFEYFACPEPFSIGIDVMSVNKILKHTVSGDILTLFVKPDCDDSSGECLGIKIKNEQKKEDSVFYIDAIESRVDKFQPGGLDYPATLSMPSGDLQSIIGKLKNTGSKTVQMIYKGGVLTFIAKGDVAKATINRHRPDGDETPDGIAVRRDDRDVGLISVYLNIDKVSEFTKCTNLSQFVLIYLKNDSPVFFEYRIGSLGKMRLGLSPRSTPDNW